MAVIWKCLISRLLLSLDSLTIHMRDMYRPSDRRQWQNQGLECSTASRVLCFLLTALPLLCVSAFDNLCDASLSTEGRSGASSTQRRGVRCVSTSARKNMCPNLPLKSNKQNRFTGSRNSGKRVVAHRFLFVLPLCFAPALFASTVHPLSVFTTNIMEFTSKNQRSTSVSTVSPPTSPVRKLFGNKRSLKNLRRRKSQEDEDLDFCCGGDEQEEELKTEQISPLPLYNKSLPVSLRAGQDHKACTDFSQANPTPSYEFPPRYSSSGSGSAKSSAKSETFNLKAEEAKAVDALNDFLQSKSGQV